MGVFITGTDTGIGKTVVSAAVIQRYRSESKLCYWKPIQTGIEFDDDTAAVRALGECRDEEIFDEGVRLTRPLSPHLSAELSNTEIDLESLLSLFLPRADSASWIVEGAGGLLVPINKNSLMIDLIKKLRSPAVIVARSSLGTINHTLLSIEALRNRSIPTAGVVMVGEPNRENRRAIERYGEIAVLAEMPLFSSLTPSILATWARDQLDRDGLLREFFCV